jgi:hypothetical protein
MIFKCDQVFHYTGKEKDESCKEATRRWTYNYQASSLIYGFKALL